MLRVYKSTLLSRKKHRVDSLLLLLPEETFP